MAASLWSPAALAEALQLVADLRAGQTWDDARLGALEQLLRRPARSLETELSDVDEDTKASLMYLSGLSSKPRASPGVSPVLHVATPRVFMEPRTRKSLAQAWSNWRFDCFELQEVSRGKALSTMFYWFVEQNGLIDQLQLVPDKLRAFLGQVERDYGNSSYHNSVHAACCLQSLHMSLHAGRVYRRLKALEADSHAELLLACYLAALCHDFRHRGVTNAFLVQTEDELARLYNDTSVQENYHCAQTFALLQQEPLNFMEDMHKDGQRYVRQMVIRMVMKTDMQQHMEVLQQFKKDDVTRTAQLALKCADLSHTTYPWELHCRWVLRLEDEMFRQGDRELRLGHQISPLMDRRKQGVSKSQVGFFTVFVIPMLETFAEAFPDTAPMLEGAKANMRRWAEGKPIPDYPKL